MAGPGLGEVLLLDSAGGAPAQKSDQKAKAPGPCGCFDLFHGFLDDTLSHREQRIEQSDQCIVSIQQTGQLQ